MIYPVFLLTEDQSFFITLDEKHHLENPGSQPMIPTDIQTASDLGGNNMTCYDYVYAQN